jgi:phage shock protein PspC (stress-responsive transcriptional regulator)
MDMDKPPTTPGPSTPGEPSTPAPAAGPVATRSRTDWRAGFADFFARVRATGVTRGDEAWAAGVCGALAKRFDVNPLWVRVGFVVLALFGFPALLAYAALWLVLPSKTGRIELEALLERDFSPAAGAALALVVLEVLTGPSFFLS